MGKKKKQKEKQKENNAPEKWKNTPIANMNMHTPKYHGCISNGNPPLK